MQQTPSPPELIGQSPVFLDALAHASQAAALDRPLLVVGERGSGKELIAARIHFLSPRWDGPLVKVNCAAMNEELLESELFGHEAGAFTGAARKHHGRFERAEGGTLFLDEIASASARVQEKLLRVIEYGEYERVGGEETLIADVRVVAAANIDLKEAARRGDFRADLLDRLAFDVIAAPPLRARKGDISQLAAHFANALARELDTEFEGFTGDAMATLTAYDWPGNIRELKNVAERSFYRWRAEERDGPVDIVIIDPFPKLAAANASEPAPPSQDIAPSPDPASVPATPRPPLNAPATEFSLRDLLDDVEKQIAVDVLAKHQGNQASAARAMRLSYNQMRWIVRKYELAPGD